MPTADKFDSELESLLSKAESLGFHSVVISAGNLHRRVGEYPGANHRMPMCCDAMRRAMRAKDEELPNDLKKNGASYQVRFSFPR